MKAVKNNGKTNIQFFKSFNQSIIEKQKLLITYCVVPITY